MRDIKAKRIVIKIGTNTLTINGKVDSGFIEGIASEISSLKNEGKEILIVTSGAIGAGCNELNFKSKPQDIKLRQACAAIGQSIVMQIYHDAFAKYNEKVAQILLTYEDFSNRKRYLNLKNSIETLLKLGVIPIINENDPISIDEIDATFGDNDRLSALVASKIEAGLLVLFSDIAGLYDKDPKKFRDAKLIKTVTELTEEVEQMAGKKGSAFSVGGMKSKIQAAKIAQAAGCNMVILDGREKNILTRLASNEEVGTLFIAKKSLPSKDRWILFSKPKGTIRLNKCAKDVLLNGKSSLLPVGIESVEGTFKKGDVVMIEDFARAIPDFSSDDINKFKGQKNKGVAVKHENIIFIKS